MQLETSSTLLSVIQKGSKIKSITLLAEESHQSDFEDQIFIILMESDKITQIFILLNYLSAVYPQLQILLPHSFVLSIQFTDLMTSIRSRDKNKLSATSSFNQFGFCRVAMDCTDIEIATPGLTSQQKTTYSIYRGMHSFEVIMGIAPNGVITYVSKLYPGSISDKAIR